MFVCGSALLQPACSVCITSECFFISPLINCDIVVMLKGAAVDQVLIVTVLIGKSFELQALV